MEENDHSTDAEEQVSVRELLELAQEYLELELLAGEGGLDKLITHQRIQKPGLAMAGDAEFVHPGRVQVFGASEIRFMDKLDAERREAVLKPFSEQPLSCVAITKGLEAPPEVVSMCQRGEIPLLRSTLLSSRFIDRLNQVLGAHFAPRTTVHGVLMDVLGVGVLLTGPSGIGKSECALDLIMRGHRLVSDDVVEIRCRQGQTLVGRGPELIRSHMEVRGLGIINIAHLFGVAATRHRKRVQMVIELQPEDGDCDCERLGIDQQTSEILGVHVPLVCLPVASGRNLSNLVEVAARSLLLRFKGFNPAQELNAKLQQSMHQPRFTMGQYDLDEGDLE